MRRGLEGVLPQISQEDMPLGTWLPTSPMHREFNNNRNVVLHVCVCVCVCVCVLGKEELAMGSDAAKVKDLLWRQLHGSRWGLLRARVLVREVG